MPAGAAGGSEVHARERPGMRALARANRKRGFQHFLELPGAVSRRPNSGNVRVPPNA